MKTPRQLLFERHRSAESKLDAVRQAALAAVSEQGTSAILSASVITDRPFSWRELVLSLRWHLAGMSAAWLLIALLNMERSPNFASTIATQNIPAPKIVLAALRENRRQLAEMIGLTEMRQDDSNRPAAPQPRSQRREETMTA